MRRALLFAVALLAWAFPAFGQQQASLRGRVTDAATGAPLPRTNVVLRDTGKGTATGEAGRYVFDGLAPGAYTLVVTYVGYRPYRRRITLVPGETRRLDVALVPMDVRTGEVIVTAAPADVEATDLGVARLSAAEVQSLPAVLEPDIFRALQLLPGIQAASDFSSGLYIRGGPPDQTLVLLDGATVFNPTHVFGLFSAFNPAAIGAVTVYKGGYPAEYGGRLGAVVALESKSGSNETQGRLSVGLLAARAAARGPHPKGTWMLAVRRSTLEPLLYTLRRAGVDDLPRRFAFYDLNGRLTLDASAADRLSFSFYAGHDRLDYRFLDDTRFHIAYGNRVAALSWKHRFSDRLSGRLRGTISHYFSTPTAVIAGTTFEQFNDVWDYGLEGDLTWTPGAGHRLRDHRMKAGLQVGRFAVRLRSRFQGELRFGPEWAATYVTGYLQDTYTPNASWEVTGGVRVSYFAEGRYLHVGPRLAATYRVAEDVRLQLGYGRYWQYLSVASNGLTSAFDRWVTAAEGVPPSYGDQFVAGLKADLTGGIRLELESYYRTMRDLFILDPFRGDPAGVPYEERFLSGDGYAYGFEFLIDREAGRVNGFLAYTLAWTRRRFQTLNESERTGRPLYYPPKYDRRHSVTLVANYDFAPSWRATAVFTYATGQAYTRPTAQYKLVAPPFGASPLDVLRSERLNGARLPPYHRLDLGVRKRGRFFGFADYELRLQLINVYGRRNIWFYFFEPQRDNTIERRAVPQIPIPLPNVSLTLEF